MELAIKEGSPCLKRLAREEGLDNSKIETLLKLHLVALDAFLKQKNGLSREEIDLVAEEIMDKYGFLISFADINVIFRDAKLGRYGELYQQLSCAKIIKWFDDYVGQRQEMSYQMNLNADRKKYGVTAGKTGDDVLCNLGYSVDKDGRISLDPVKVAQQNAKLELERKKKAEEAQAKIDKDNEYLKWRLNYEKTGQL